MWMLVLVFLPLLGEATLASTNDVLRCLSSQEDLGEFCIRRVPTKVPFLDALLYCRAFGGKLVEIGRWQTMEALLALLKEGDSYWVQVTPTFNENLHKSGHDQGDSSRKSHYTSGQCSVLFKDSHHRWLQPPQCDDKFAFICSYKHLKARKPKRESPFWCARNCLGTRRTTTTKKPPATKPKGTITPPDLGAFTAFNPESLANMSLSKAMQRWATAELVNQLQSVVPDIWILSLLMKASDILTQITMSSDLLSPAVQVNASNAFVQMTDQLYNTIYQATDISVANVTDAANALFQGTDSTFKASLDNYYNLTADQANQIFDSSMTSVDNLEYALLYLNDSAIQNHSFSSTISSLTVARINSTDLSLESFTTNQPAMCKVTFPSSPAMKYITDEFQTLNIQVLALSVNPFRYINQKTIVDPVVNIVLSSDVDGIEVANLTDYIEILLIRNTSSSSNVSTVSLTKDWSLSVVVNMTTDNNSLVVTVQPDIPLPLTLYLGFQEKANSSHFTNNVSLSSDDGYTWVLPPDQLNGSGIYYVDVTVSNQSIWNEIKILNISVTMFSTQCVYWDELVSDWSDEGCHVGPKSSIVETQCLCTHLTFFGATFFVMPHVVDLSDTLSLFANVSKNPVGLALLGALLGFYLLVVMWAWRKDKEDVTKVRVAILTDNDPAFHSRYVIKVCTGFRKGAGTTSQVVVTLYGSGGKSDPHILSDPEKQVFTRGSVDVFLLKTRHLGELHSLRLWHSNSGSSPSWYVHRVSVIDLAAQKTWYFLCDAWLASNLADCQLDRIFPSASKSNLRSLRYIFFSGSIEKFLKDHLWLSVYTRCPWSPFTRVQRICCCMSLLFCSLVINIMFWNLQSDDHSETGNFLITFTQIKISFQSALMLVPVNLLIVQMFQLIQVQIKQVIIPQNKLRATLAPNPVSKEGATEKLLKDLKDMVDYLNKYIVQVLGESPTMPVGTNTDPLLQCMDELSYLIQSFICVHGPERENPTGVIVMTPQQCLFLHYLYKLLDKLQLQVSSVDLSHVAKPINYIQASNIIYDLQDLLRSQSVTGAPLPNSLTTSFPVATQQRTRCSRIPKAFTYVCWFFLFAISSFSAYYMVLISLDMTKTKATSWLISILLSLSYSLFFLPPVKVLAQTIILFRVLRRNNIEDTSEEQQLHGILSILASQQDWELSGWRDQGNKVYQAPTNQNITNLKKQAVMEKKLYKLIHDIFVHVMFLVITMITAYSEKGPNEYYLNSAIDNSFSATFSNIGNIADFYSWSWRTLLPNLYNVFYTGFITDGNCFLVGPARIRQLRRVPNSAGHPNLYDTEDTGSYGFGWAPVSNNDSQDNWWKYHTENDLGGYPIWAQLGTYSGGGYVVEFGMNKSSASSVLKILSNNNWLDSYTKAVFLEFNVYNANVNLFCLATFILETTVIGDFLPSVDLQIMRLYISTGDIYSVQFISEIIFLVILLYIIIQQILCLKSQKWRYFYSATNLLDLSIVVISCSNTALYVKKMLLRQKVIERYHLDRTRFVSFYETATVDSVHGYSVAFLVALMTVKLWRLLNLNPNLHLITMTLRKAWNELGGFLLTIFILLLAYSISCNLLFGWSIYSYKTFFSSMVTIISLLLGIFNYDEVFNLDPVLGSLLIITCVIFLIFVVVNIFLSGLLGIFSKERQNPTPYEEKEIVDLLLLKLSGLFGIRKKPKAPEEDPTDKEKVT
ncbi:polycystin-1-like protein 3 [Pelodytes ibericus]